VFFLPGLAQEQGMGKFTGIVTDVVTGEALIGANVVLKQDPSFGAATSVDGRFSINLMPGQYHFQVSFTGMLTDTVQIAIRADQVIDRVITLMPYVNELQGIEVRAGRFDQRIEEITVSMEIIKPGLIEDKNTRSIQTILDYTPGVNILDNEPQIRGGSGFTFGVGSKVAIIVDDIPMLSGDAGRPYWDFIPVENIEQIEVIKGASTVLSGTAALSGAIHIRTAAPGLKPVTKIQAYSGVWSTPEDQAMKWWDDFPYIAGVNFLHTRKANNLDITLGGTVNFDHGAYGPPRPGPLVVDTISDFSDQDMASQKVRLNFNLRKRSGKIQGLNFGLNGNFMYNKAPMVLAWLDDTTGFYETYPGAVMIQNMFIAHLDPYINYYSDAGFKHSFKARVLYNDNNQTNNQAIQSLMAYGDYNFTRKYDFLDGMEFIGGLSTQYATSHAEMYVGAGNEINNSFNLSAYAQIENNFFKILNLSIGARLEYYSMTAAEEQIKPIFRAGMSLKVFKETYVRVSYGQGYRYPTIAERYIRTVVGTFGMYENKELKPETSWNAEFGLKQGFKFLNYFGYFDMALFQQEYSNTIEYLFGFWDSTYSVTIAGAGFKFVNTGKSRVTGVDFSLTGMANLGAKGNMKTILGYTYIMPVTLQPDYVFAYDYPVGYEEKYGPEGRPQTYNSTSIDPSENILKYRFLSTFKGDIEFNFYGVSIGLSGKYFSPIKNLDKSIEEFEKATANTGGTLQEIRYMDYFYSHNSGNFIVDTRLSYEFNEHHKAALICNNLTNLAYSLRPLKSEPMRSVILQYTLNL
jgi:iron complex outermembrane receptor protein